MKRHSPLSWKINYVVCVFEKVILRIFVNGNCVLLKVVIENIIRLCMRISKTKISVVFDASALTSNNKSLNVMLLKSPTLQEELFNLLICFRFPTYTMMTDIENMYLQI